MCFPARPLILTSIRFCQFCWLPFIFSHCFSIPPLLFLHPSPSVCLSICFSWFQMFSHLFSSFHIFCHSFPSTRFPAHSFTLTLTLQVHLLQRFLFLFLFPTPRSFLSPFHFPLSYFRSCVSPPHDCLLCSVSPTEDGWQRTRNAESCQRWAALSRMNCLTKFSSMQGHCVETSFI